MLGAGLNLRLVGLGIALAAIVFAVFALYRYGYAAGWTAGATQVRAEWHAERARQADAFARAVNQRDAAERDAAKTLKRITDAHSADLARRDDAVAAARVELVRLRDALSRARATRARDEPPSAAARRPADDPDARPGELLAQCAGELVQMAERAGSLAAQVIGLQAYARLAQSTCGAAP